MRTLLGLLLLCLVGCNSIENSTTTFYKKDGSIDKIIQSEISKPAIEQITDSTKNKIVLVWGDGIDLSFSVSPGTSENPFPHVKGKFKNGSGAILTCPKDLTEEQMLAAAVLLKAITGIDISVSAKGIDITK